MAFRTFALASAFLALAPLLMCSHVLAAQHTVGGSSGWDTGVDYTTWASQQTFKTGDTLLFTYGGLHSVDQVSQSDYASCSAANVISSDASGSTTVTLDKAQSYYFICGVTSHCTQGMKLSVKVTGSASSSSPSSSTTAPSSSSPSSSSSSSSSTPTSSSTGSSSSSATSPQAPIRLILSAAAMAVVPFFLLM